MIAMSRSYFECKQRARDLLAGWRVDVAISAGSLTRRLRRRGAVGHSGS